MDKNEAIAFLNEAKDFLQNHDINEKYKPVEIEEDGKGYKMNMIYLSLFLRPILRLDEKIKKNMRFPPEFIEKLEKVQSTTNSPVLYIHSNADFKITKIERTWKIYATMLDMLAISEGESYFLVDDPKKEILQGEPGDFWIPREAKHHVFYSWNKRPTVYYFDVILESANEIKEPVKDLVDSLMMIWLGKTERIIVEEGYA